MQSIKDSKKFNDIIETSLKNLSEMIDVNTVIGAPIKTGDNEFIMPVSKVTFGVLAGGGEYGKINIFKSAEDLPYSAGNGAIVSVKPCCFLIKTGENDYKILTVDGGKVDNLIDKSFDIINKIQRDGK